MNLSLRAAAAGFSILIPSPAVPAGASETSLRERIVVAAAAEGIDVRPLFEREIRAGDRLVPLGALVDAADTSGAAEGPAGTGEVQAGDIFHVAVDYGLGIPHAYEVSQSKTIPATPSVSTAVGFLVLGQMFVEYGGPVVQIRGGGWEAGGTHLIGGTMTNVSTAGTDPLFVTVSGVATRVAQDDAIDFTGHAGTIVNVRECLFTFCIAVGSVLGDGVAFYGSDVAPGVARPATPVIP